MVVFALIIGKDSSFLISGDGSGLKTSAKVLFSKASRPASASLIAMLL
jgi:hypothetical protein